MQYARPSAITSALLSGGLGLLGLMPMASASASTPVQATSPESQPQVQLQPTRLSLLQAIDAAEAAFPGRAIDAQSDTDAGIAHYEVEIITPQGSHVEVHVDATTGVARLHKDRGPVSAQDQQQLDASKITLQQALDAALRHTPGTAIEADLGHENGRSVFAVDVLTAAGLRVEIQLNPEDGNVLRAKID